MKSKRNFVSSLNKWFSPSEKRDFRSKKVRFEDRVSKSRREFYLNFRSWKKFNIEKAVLFPRFYFNFFHWRVIFFFFTFWPLEIRVRKLIKKKGKNVGFERGKQSGWRNEREVAITRKNREGGLVKDIEYRLSGRRSRIRIPSSSFHFSSSRYTSALLLCIITIPYSLYHQLWIKSTRYTYSYNFAPNEIPRERERESMWNRLHVSPKLTVES